MRSYCVWVRVYARVCAWVCDVTVTVSARVRVCVCVRGCVMGLRLRLCRMGALLRKRGWVVDIGAQSVRGYVRRYWGIIHYNNGVRRRKKATSTILALPPVRLV